MEELQCGLLQAPKALASGFPVSRVLDPQKSEMETDPAVPADLQPLQEEDLRMEESGESPGDYMVCDSAARLVYGGISKSSCTDDVVVFINAGSEVEIKGDSNMRFLADAHFKGGSILRIKESIREGGDYPFIYQSARLGDFTYQLNGLPAGDYYIDLHFAEIINVNGPKGMRVFNVLIQDEKVLSELDIYALVGANKPLQMVDFRAFVKEDDLIDIRFEGVVGSPVACGVCIRRAPKLPDSLLKHERIRCSSCTADIELPMTLMRDMRQRNTAMFEKKIEDLNIKLDRKKEECSLAWMSLTAANDQLTKIRTELDNKLFQTYTLDQRVEKQTAEIKALCSRYEEGKKTWINAISNLENKIKAMKQEHIELSHEAHQCADSIPELNQMICAVQALVAECEDLKTKYLDEQRMRKKLYNEVQEAKGNIRVFCRCRPLTRTEQAAGHSAIVDFEGAKDGDIVIQNGGSNKKSFKFDRVYCPTNDQVDVFADASPVVTSVLDGYNVCIFAYGQTGTGKTFTMEGTEQNRGVNYRTLEQLFKIAQERKDTFAYEISVSVLEIYNDQIRDLLATSSSKKLEIKQDYSGSHHVPGLVEAKVDNTQEVWRVLQVGSNARAVGSNNVNERSSRSHCMLCVMVRAKNLMSGESTKSKLWLVDLAGSERLAKTDAQGERLKEAQNINKSLSALGDVISALANKSSHIPYRNSKLTHLLQDSLGGDSKTLMFVQISPSERDMGETLSSLNFASRVRGVELGPVKKQVDSSELQKTKMQLDKARMEIKKLEESLQNLENKARGLEDKLGSKISMSTQLEKENSQLQERLKGKEEACSSLQHKVNELENKRRQLEHMDSATLEQVKELERKLKEQTQESDSLSLILQSKIKEQNLKEQDHNHEVSLLHEKVKELEKKVKELEQNSNQPTNDAHDMAVIGGVTPAGSRPALKEEEVLAEIDPLVLRSSNSVSSMGSNDNAFIKGNGEPVRRKREFRNSDIENNVPMSGPSQHDKKIRKSDPPRAFMRPTRNAAAKPVAGQRPYSFGRSTRDQGNKDKDTKKKMWC